MFEWIPKPKSRQGVGVAIIIALFATVLAVWLLISSFDIIPDSIGPFGYLDDAIMIIIIFVFSYRVFNRITGRFKRNKQAYKDYFAKHSLFGLIGSLRFWVTLGIIALCTSYVFWAVDLIPDATPIIGYIDDGMAIVFTLKTLFDFIVRGR